MATHDYNIANQSGASFRQDLNNALSAIVTLNSSDTEPATKFAHMLWLDTANDILKIRNADNSAWIDWITQAGVQLLPDGTVGAPGLTFASETDTGLYRIAANTLGIATSGTERVEISDTGIIINEGGDDADVRIEGDANANLVFIDAGNDRVGIGFASEQARLEVQGQTAAANTANTPETSATTSAFRVKGASDDANSLWMGIERSNQSPYIQAANGTGSATKPLLLNAFGGKVGIGETTVDDALFVIKGDSNGDTNPSIRLKDGTDTREAWISNTAGDLVLVNGGNDNVPHCKITLFDSNIIRFDTANTEAMRIDSSGNVGIGTSSPGFPLHVKNADSSACRFVLENSGSASNDSTQIYSQNNDLVFVANDSDRVRIDSSGRVLIGVDSSYANGDADDLQVGNNSASAESGITLGSTTGSGIRFADAGNASAGQMQYKHSDNSLRFNTNGDNERLRIGGEGHLFNTCNDNSEVSLTLKKGSGGDAVDFFTCLNSSNGEKFTIKASGNAENANNSYGSTSDAKLKENIVDASSQWDDIKAVQIRNYNFKEDTGYETHTQIGVIAQELETVSPGLVSESPDRETVQVPVLDEDGEAVLDENGQAVFNTEVRDLGTVTKSVKQSVLYMKAVKALQEAMNRIETLEAKVAALEAG